MSIIIIGAGKKAEHFCDLFKLWERVTQFFEVPRTARELKRGRPVVDKILFPDKLHLVYSAVGDTRPKRELVKRFEETTQENGIQYMWGQTVHPTSVITALQDDVGMDFIVRELSSVGTLCKIGDHVSIGPLANVSHHTSIGDYTTICGQAAISGSVELGEGVFIGQGAMIKPGVKIGDGAVLGTGSVVVSDVLPDSVVGGNPAWANPKFRKVEKWNPSSS